MRLTSKGQVTIPQELREKLGLLPHSEVEFELDGDAVRIRKARKSTRRGERSWIACAVLPRRVGPRMKSWPSRAAERGDAG